jgi:hypothetical protein
MFLAKGRIGTRDEPRRIAANVAKLSRKRPFSDCSPVEQRF